MVKGLVFNRIAMDWSQRNQILHICTIITNWCCILQRWRQNVTLFELWNYWWIFTVRSSSLHINFNWFTIALRQKRTFKNSVWLVLIIFEWRIWRLMNLWWEIFVSCFNKSICWIKNRTWHCWKKTSKFVVVLTYYWNIYFLLLSILVFIIFNNFYLAVIFLIFNLRNFLNFLNLSILFVFFFIRLGIFRHFSIVFG